MKGKRILLGITGGIAAYKIAFLIRLLKKEEAEVRCIMTPASCDFISPLTISTLSENPVYIDFWNQTNGEWTNHVDLGMWPDIFLIAPLTANSLAKLAHGYCDNLLTATYLSAKCEVIVAPAMDLDMYAHPTTFLNLEILQSHGVKIIPAEEGELASGLVGKGRLAEPETIVDVLKTHFQKKNDFIGKKVLITAGPTYEHIDPVRFIGNHSSGKMGFDIARCLLDQGAEIILVSGPTKETLHHPKLNLIKVISADEMLESVQQNWSNCTIGIFCAAVADYKPVMMSEQKIKKSDESFMIELVKNPDILEWAGQHKANNQFLVGFALETQNARQYAMNKKVKKNLDAIILNTLEDEGAGFGLTTNKIEIITPNNLFLSFPMKNKTEVASDIVSFIFENLD